MVGGDPPVALPALVAAHHNHQGGGTAQRRQIPHPPGSGVMHRGRAGPAGRAAFHRLGVGHFHDELGLIIRSTFTTRMRRRCNRTLMASWGAKPRRCRCFTNHEHHGASPRQRGPLNPRKRAEPECWDVADSLVYAAWHCPPTRICGPACERLMSREFGSPQCQQVYVRRR
jgi:hypothetical protein